MSYDLQIKLVKIMPYNLQNYKQTDHNKFTICPFVNLGLFVIRESWERAESLRQIRKMEKSRD